jgi:acetyl-CoA decarbonylase/synthase complex subunit beta
MDPSTDAKDVLQPLLLGAETYEASMEDKDKYFITDHRLRSLVFSGSKWRAGWALVLGGSSQAELISKLIEKGFMVFTDTPDLQDTFFIGSRQTSPIYFLQMMVRYGLTWGRIQPGDDHEMGHFLEKDLPGLMIITEDLPPLKYLIALGIMKLGAPAIVPHSFPFPYGTRIASSNPIKLVEDGIHFPNLRMRYYKDEVIELPEYCNPAFVNEIVEGGAMLGGDPNSFFCLTSAKAIVPGLEILGQASGSIGILVEVEHEDLTDDLTQVVQRSALKAINYLPEVRAYEKQGVFSIQLAEGVKLDTERIGAAIYYGVRLQYPRLECIRIQIIFDEARLLHESNRVKQFMTNRQHLVSGMTEENTEEYCVCIECRTFSLEHTCILTPDRIPMCASRTYFTIKADSCFGTSVVPFQRQSEKELPLKLVFNKGELLDPLRGEYTGSNQMYRDLTGGKLRRVYLHSLRDYPHTSCGCFQTLAFWIDEVQGIGIMSRGSKATAPNGVTWNSLANKAGGKQAHGVMGVSISYIRSPKFLKADGGIENVVWVDEVLYSKIQSAFKPGQKVATERQTKSIAELVDFIKRA